MGKISVSVIGSFRQYYDDVVIAVKEFQALGIDVKSPPVSTIVNPGASFARFAEDPPTFSDSDIQEVTIEKILSSNVVYVVAPQGYVGQTTCYELGRIHGRKISTYFSHRPTDLPVFVPEENIVSPGCLARRIANAESFEGLRLGAR